MNLAIGGITLRFEFKKKKIEDLYTKEKNAHKYPSAVVDSFFDVMSVIAAAKDERDLYALKGLRFEKLKGRSKDRSLRLNKQWRLIVSTRQDNDGTYILIIDIEDYH